MVKFTLEQATKAQTGKKLYSSSLSLTSALDWGAWSASRPAALPPAMTRYPLFRRLGGPQSRSGRGRKISLPTGIRSPDRPARRKSLYRLSYPDPTMFTYIPYWNQQTV